MKTRQKRAIWYAERKRKLEKLDRMGLLDEYYQHFYNGRHKIEYFCRKKGIRL